MRILITLIFIFISEPFLTGQPSCVPPYRSVEFYANTVRTSVQSNSALFYSLDKGFVFPGYLDFPSVPTPSLIFQQQFWIGGLDEQGEWKDSYSLNNFQGYGFVNGPAILDPSECKDWGHVWLVSGLEVATFKEDFKDGVIDDTPSLSILNWPGQGNPYIEDLMGIKLPNQEMAPFYDQDLNGIYDPWQGDYPIIGEDCPDFVPTLMAWTIYNDVSGLQNSIYGTPLGVEVSITVFATDFPSPDNILAETIFTRYQTRNVGTDSLFDIRVGHYVDAEIGCGADDLVGCNPGFNTFYAYNDGPDSKFCPQGIPGYEEDPPVLTVAFLSNPLASFTSWNRNIPDDLMDTVSASKSLEHVFHGLWADGTPMTIGGNGKGTSLDTTTFLFSGIPSDTSSWAHSNSPLFEQGDRRLFGVLFPFNLPPQQSRVHYAAYSAHHKSGLQPVEQVDYALSRLPFLKSFYNSCFTLPMGNPEVCLTDCIWPGDLDANGICNNLDVLDWGVSAGHTGESRSFLFSGWLPQDGEHWGKTGLLNTDARHQDANGDGTINTYDRLVIEENYGRTNETYTDWGGYSISGPEIQLTRLFNPLTSPDELVAPGEKFMVRFDVADWPVDSIYGIAYSIRYDPAVVTLEQILNIIPKSSYLVDQSDLYYAQQEGRLDIAITKSDQQNVPFSPFELGKLMFTVNADPDQMTYPDTTVIVVQNIKAYLADGTLLIPGSMSLFVPYGFTTGVDIEEKPIHELQVSPNPTTNNVYWTSTFPLDMLDLYSIQGKHVQNLDLGGDLMSGEISIEQPAGIYILLGRGKNGSLIRESVVKF